MLFSERTVALIPVMPIHDEIKGLYFDKIGDKTLLSWHLAGLKVVDEIDEICLCTIEGKHAKKVKMLACQEQVSFYCHEGKKKDLITVLSQAGGVLGAKICVQTQAQCPLIELRKLWKEILFLKCNPNAGLVSSCEGAQVSRRILWEKASQLRAVKRWAEKPFPIVELSQKKPKDYIGISMNEAEDCFRHGKRMFSVEDKGALRLIRKLYKELKEEGKDFTYYNAMGVLQRYPQLERKLPIAKASSKKHKAFVTKMKGKVMRVGVDARRIG